MRFLIVCDADVFCCRITGFGYAMYAAAVWPSVAYLVPSQRLGMAYGISTCMRAALSSAASPSLTIVFSLCLCCSAALNLCLTVFPVCVAAIRTANGSSFTFVELFFASLAGVAAVLCIPLNMWDKKYHNGRMNARGRVEFIPIVDVDQSPLVRVASPVHAQIAPGDHGNDDA